MESPLPLEPEPAAAPADAGAERSGASPGARLLRLALLLGALLLVSELLGVRQRVSADPRAAVEDLRVAMQSAGPWGALLFVVVFCLGELIHVPGLVFVAAGVLAYGQVQGGALSYLAGVASMTVSFLVVRGVSGQALAEIDKPWLKRAMQWVDARPVTTIAALRAVLLLSPPLNYALALSSVRLREYVLGSALGLIPPILVAVLAFDWVIRTFL